MTNHLETGIRGEYLAMHYLNKMGYTILNRNWRSGYYEIDIIAKKNNKIHFVEVKTRSSLTFGYPEESVTSKKFKCLQKAAATYQTLHPEVRNIQFDILSILIVSGQEIEYFFIEDVYLD